MNTESTQTHPDDLLPWYVNGSLDDEERAQVAQHLEVCERCRREVEFLGKLRLRVGEENELGAPGELGLHRLRRDIQAERAKRGARHAWWRPAFAAAAVLIIAVQAVMLINVAPQPTEGIVPLGSEQRQGQIQIRFRPDATETRIRAVLQSVGAVIVDGPGALGIYRVRLKGEGATDPARIAAAVEKLRAQTEVVSHAAAE